MKRMIFSLIAVLFLLNGCLIVRSFEYRISFDENFNRAKIKIIFGDLRSDHISDATKMDSVAIKELQQKRQGDFDELLEMITDDEPLLDAVGMGIYLKKRYLFASENLLNGCWEGIFGDLRFTEEEESLKVLKNEIVLKIKKDDDTEYIETDGKLLELGEYIQITWPKTQRDIYWKLISKDDPTASISLLEEYQKWKGGRELE